MTLKPPLILAVMMLLVSLTLQAKEQPRPLYDGPVHIEDGGVVQNPHAQGLKPDLKTKTDSSFDKTKDSPKPKHKKKKGGRLWEYKRTHFNHYSINDEIAIGEKFIKEQELAFEKRKLKVNPPEWAQYKKRIDAIVARLAPVSDLPHLPYEVTLFDKPDVANAYCFPGGKIGVFTGLFDTDKGLIDPKKDDEIAAVLAHEMAHAGLRHVTRQMTTYNSVSLVGSLVTLGLSQGVGQNWAYLAGQVFNTGTFLAMPSYSRKHEREADKVGFYYLAKAGFNPMAAITVWERAALKAKSKGKDKTSFFASHPASGERAASLRGFYEDALEVIKRQEMVTRMKE
ncbi:MAG: M48 family metallopeptidase [Deltaproteobacteria bacterium]|nr:M48 family metallopeptidase [Deltaproteobacteria bacterium]